MLARMQKTARAALLAARFALQKKLDGSFPERERDVTQFLLHEQDTNKLDAWYLAQLTQIENMPRSSKSIELRRHIENNDDDDELLSLEEFFGVVLSGVQSDKLLTTEQQMMLMAVQMIEFCVSENFAAFARQTEDLARDMGYASVPQLRKKPGAYIVDLLLRSEPKQKSRGIKHLLKRFM
jgi:hypothetical protein